MLRVSKGEKQLERKQEIANFFTPFPPCFTCFFNQIQLEMNGMFQPNRLTLAERLWPNWWTVSSKAWIEIVFFPKFPFWNCLFWDDLQFNTYASLQGLKFHLPKIISKKSCTIRNRNQQGGGSQAIEEKTFGRNSEQKYICCLQSEQKKPFYFLFCLLDI